MAEIARHDRGGLAAPVSGRLYSGIAARVHGDGDPLVYKAGPEYRRADELKRIVDLLTGTPVIVNHPPNGGMIAEGAKPRVVGRVVSARLDGDVAVADIFITDPEGEKALRRGVRELSLGYYAGLDQERRQIGTRIDHLALVPQGRCGATCRVRTDAAGAEACGCSDGLEPSESSAEACSCKNHANLYTTPQMPDTTNVAGDDESSMDSARGDKQLSAKDRHTLKSASFAVPGREGLPIEDEGHVQVAMSRFGQEDFQSSAEKRTAYHKIVARAHELGVDSKGFEKKWGGRLDGASPDDAADQKDAHMDELKKQLAEAVKDAAAQRARADQADQDLQATKIALTKAEVEATNAKATLQSATSRADAAEAAATAAGEKARQDAASTFDAAVNERVEILTAASRVLPDKDKDGKAIDRRAQSNKALKIEMIKHVDGLDVAADKPDLFVDGVYEGALSRHAAGSRAQASARSAVATARQDNAEQLNRPSGVSAEQQARNKMIDRTTTEWSQASK